MLPNRIGRYEVLGQLATGGMAEILLARLSGPSQFRRAVVIKRILRQYAQTESFVAMFLDEARTVAKIRHPNVVQVQELGEADGDVFLVLEYIAGENLSSVLKRATAQIDELEPPLVAHIVAEACAGLHAAHELVSDEGRRQNLVHRDVSPQNIFVAYEGHVKILDFGVALTEERITRTEVGDVKGKAEYMSPEQVNGEPLDRRSDIFAMGIVLYELATGRRLFKRANQVRVIDAICNEPVLPPSQLVDGFPPALEAIILRALSKRPDDRYDTAADMRRDLLTVARPLHSPVDSLAERMHRLFADRIAEKEELLRRVRDGQELPRMPLGEVEETIRVPRVPEGDEARTVVAVAAEPRIALAPARGRRRLGVAITLGTAAAVAGTAALFLGDPVPAPASLSATAAPGATASTWSSEPAPEALPATASSMSSMPPASIVVHIESHPPGAHVFAGGADRGVTPIDLRVARATTPIVFELRSPGFAVTSQSMVPDVDQKLLLDLQPLRGPRLRAPPGTAPAPPKPSASDAPGGFRRFD